MCWAISAARAGPRSRSGSSPLGLLFALDRVPRLPGGLVVLRGAIVISTAFQLDHHGVATVGKVAAGLPSVHAVRLSASNLWVLLPSAAGMLLVIFSEALGAAQTFADKHGYRLDPSQDMIALAWPTSPPACSAGWPPAGACLRRPSTTGPARRPNCPRSSPRSSA